MQDFEFNIVNLILGERKTGKTVFTVGEKEKQLPAQIIPPYVERGLKVLIVDTLDHPSYQHIPVIRQSQINNRWKKGVYRTFVNFTEMNKLMLHLNADNFFNGAIIFEDAYKHQRLKLTPACAALIGDSKQKNVDLHFMYHSWKFVPKDLITYLDYIEYFKVRTAPGDREEDSLGDRFPEVLECHNRVAANPNRFYHESICVEQ